MPASYTDRTGHEKLLILCPSISSDTLLHLSVQGTSYHLRDFSGRLTGTQFPSGEGKPFKVTDAEGRLITNTCEFRKQFPYEVKKDASDEPALHQTEHWRSFISRQNIRFGIGV